MRARQRVQAVADRLGFEALEAEVQNDEVPNVNVVFDNENAGHRASSVPQFRRLGLGPGCGRHSFLTPAARAVPR